MAVPSQQAAEVPPAAQRRRIGVPGLVFFVVAASAPLTVAAGGIPQSLGVTGVIGLPLLYLLITAVLALFSAGYAAMSRRITGAGAFYAYAAQGLGRVPGVGTAFVALLSYNAMQIGIAGLFGAVASDFVEARTGAEIPWWVLVFGCAALVGFLGYRRVDLSARVLAVLLAVEFATVLVFDIGQFAHAPHGVSAEPLTWSAAVHGPLGLTLCFVFAAFMGFESAALYSEECRDPRRTVARATYLAVALIGGFYAFTAWAMIVGAGTGEAGAMAGKYGADMMFVLGEHATGPAFSDIAQFFFLTSLLAALLSFHNAVARYIRSLGREAVLPVFLGAAHPRHGSPHRGSLVQTALTFAVVGAFALAGRDPVADLFTWLTNLGALGVILLLLVTSAAVVRFFAGGPGARGGAGAGAGAGDESVWNRLLAPLAAGIALAVIFSLGLTNFGAQLGVAPGNPLRWIFPGLVLVAAVLGLAWGVWLRAARPATYRGIGTAAAVEDDTVEGTEGDARAAA
ncbi:APC family permease [Streptomyces sp. NPDC048172]|uniref:APC family permease n=1 Tax=Streptomyces sp. NPDC048172 TaxID=3365505 RepID=UPI003721E074